LAVPTETGSTVARDAFESVEFTAVRDVTGPYRDPDDGGASRSVKVLDFPGTDKQGNNILANGIE
jgi:hypothetical protein